MAGACTASACRQLVRPARSRLPLFTNSRRSFITTSPLRANDSPEASKRAAKSNLLSSPLSAGTPKSTTHLPPSQGPNRPRPGSLGSSTVWGSSDDSYLMPDFTLDASPRVSGASPGIKHDEGVSLEDRNWTFIDKVLHPNPDTHGRWLRRMVIRDVRRRGKLSKQEIIMRTERESTSKSHWFKTSLKKLRPLATQIAGKNIDDAILQMRFSKKKAAKDLKDFLEQAKREAMLARGMGAGQIAGASEEGDAFDAESAFLDSGSSNSTPTGKAKPVEVRVKDGRTLKIADKTSIYIAQAWVNRGPYGRELDYRARAAAYMMRPPWTGITVVLKEEATRIREARERHEREAKQRMKKVWVPLPDRKITGQSQYYSW